MAAVSCTMSLHFAGYIPHMLTREKMLSATKKLYLVDEERLCHITNVDALRLLTVVGVPRFSMNSLVIDPDIVHTIPTVREIYESYGQQAPADSSNLLCIGHFAGRLLCFNGSSGEVFLFHENSGSQWISSRLDRFFEFILETYIALEQADQRPFGDERDSAFNALPSMAQEALRRADPNSSKNAIETWDYVMEYLVTTDFEYRR